VSKFLIYFSLKRREHRLAPLFIIYPHMDLFAGNSFQVLVANFYFFSTAKKLASGPSTVARACSPEAF
jgi:hypothetical protein